MRMRWLLAIATLFTLLIAWGSPAIATESTKGFDSTISAYNLIIAGSGVVALCGNVCEVHPFTGCSQLDATNTTSLDKIDDNGYDSYGSDNGYITAAAGPHDYG